MAHIRLAFLASFLLAMVAQAAYPPFESFDANTFIVTKPTIAVRWNPTTTYIPYLNAGVPADSGFYAVASTNIGLNGVLFIGTRFETSAGLVTNNLTSMLSGGSAHYIDVSATGPATVTNLVSGAVDYAHATNGVVGQASTVMVWMPNGSGSGQTLTINANWRTNVYSAVPTTLTNGTVTVMYLKFLGIGDTSTAAKQTNCYVSFEFYK